MSLQPATNKQVPDNAILDLNGKQTYLGNHYVYSRSSTVAATTETPIILLKNPAVTTGSFPSRYVSLFCDVRKLACLTVGETAILKFYISPTISGNGTPATALNLRPASTNLSIASLFVSPTISGNGTQFDILGSSAFDSKESHNNLIILDPGKNMLVTITASANPTAYAAQLSWWEI